MGTAARVDERTTTKDGNGSRGPGRPRDRAASQRLLDAALELLADNGFTGVTIRAIADAAGVGLPAIYRRWESKEALLYGAVSSALHRALPVPDHGDVRADLVALVRAEIEVLNTPRLGGVLQALIGQSLHDPAWRQLLMDLHHRRRAANRLIVERAVACGELPAGTDPDLLLDVLHGPLWLRFLTSAGPVPAELAEALVDTALSAVGARPVHLPAEHNHA